jgi:hypothetical protein
VAVADGVSVGAGGDSVDGPNDGLALGAGGDSVDGPNDGLALGGALSQPLGGVVPDWVQLWVGANGAPQEAPNGV